MWLVSWPVQAAQYLTRPLSALAWAGTAVRAVGPFFEAVGDAQPAPAPSSHGHHAETGERVGEPG